MGEHWGSSGQAVGKQWASTGQAVGQHWARSEQVVGDGQTITITIANLPCLSKVCPRFVQGLPKVCSRFVQDLSKICPGPKYYDIYAFLERCGTWSKDGQSLDFHES